MSDRRDNALTTLSAPRLPWHPIFADQFGIDEGIWPSLIEAVFPNARSIDSIRLALSYCKARHLDVFKRPINIVPVYSSAQKKYVETIWPGIGELRTTAMRTREYAGCDDTIFGDYHEATFIERRENDRRQIEEIEHKLTYPTWAQVTVYRLDRTNTPRAVRGPRVLFMEIFSPAGRDNPGCPNERWRRAPTGQLEKCAEAAALRRGFPEELGDTFIDDEAGRRMMVDVTPDAPPPESSPESGPGSGPNPGRGREHTGNAGLRERLAVALHAASDRPSSPANVAKVVGDAGDMLDELDRRAGVQKSPAKPQEGASLSDDQSHAKKQDSPSTAAGAAGAGQQSGAGAPVPPPGSPVADAEGGTATPGSTDFAGESFAVITPVRKGRSFDWADYAERYIAAGLQVPRERLTAWRGRQAAMFDGLHQQLPQAWAKANQALAYYERTGLRPSPDGEVPE